VDNNTTTNQQTAARRQRQRQWRQRDSATAAAAWRRLRWRWQRGGGAQCDGSRRWTGRGQGQWRSTAQDKRVAQREDGERQCDNQLEAGGQIGCKHQLHNLLKNMTNLPKQTYQNMTPEHDKFVTRHL